MEFHVIDTGNFMVDGGTMFGTVPKVQWSSLYPCNKDNYCNLSMRSLLVDTGNRVFLVDNGMGNKQSESFYADYHLNGSGELIRSLNSAGYKPEDITDMVLTHLHFDHCGGSVFYNADRTKPELTFPNAVHWVGKAQWDNFLNPNRLEQDAFFKEDMMPVFEADKLKFIDENKEFAPGFFVRIFNGHTPGQILPFITFKGKTLVYTADLIPMAASVQPDWISAYDTFPLISIHEKETFLKEAAENGYILFLEHDLYNECCLVEQTEDGFKVGKTGLLKEFTE
ncbi:MBL fold metallo-hydrolase [Saccharicrinis sp. FJH62]|uniref:MBL fold metallo-hydrolase n=1 Tax=Saccharicrinis sp. FJH62 TaxID=3344657 RepID=UPI0035D4F3B0